MITLTLWTWSFFFDS